MSYINYLFKSNILVNNYVIIIFDYILKEGSYYNTTIIYSKINYNYLFVYDFLSFVFKFTNYNISFVIFYNFSSGFVYYF